MVTRPALQELRAAIAEFAISAAVSELFTVLTLTTVRDEELSDGFRRATLAFGPSATTGRSYGSVSPTSLSTQFRRRSENRLRKSQLARVK
jgi:hypothetical protein